MSVPRFNSLGERNWNVDTFGNATYKSNILNPNAKFFFHDHDVSAGLGFGMPRMSFASSFILSPLNFILSTVTNMFIGKLMGGFMNNSTAGLPTGQVSIPSFKQWQASLTPPKAPEIKQEAPENTPETKPEDSGNTPEDPKTVKAQATNPNDLPGDQYDIEGDVTQTDPSTKEVKTGNGEEKRKYPTTFTVCDKQIAGESSSGNVYTFTLIGYNTDKGCPVYQLTGLKAHLNAGATNTFNKVAYNVTGGFVETSQGSGEYKLDDKLVMEAVSGTNKPASTDVNNRFAKNVGVDHPQTDLTGNDIYGVNDLDTYKENMMNESS